MFEWREESIIANKDWRGKIGNNGEKKAKKFWVLIKKDQYPDGDMLIATNDQNIFLTDIDPQLHVCGVKLPPFCRISWYI